MKLQFSHKVHGTGHRLALPKDSFVHKIGRDPIGDWLIMLAVSLFLIILGVGIGYIKFVSSNEIIHSVTDVALPAHIVSFNDTKLDALLEVYATKQKTRESIIAGQSTIPDPGL